MRKIRNTIVFLLLVLLPGSALFAQVSGVVLANDDSQPMRDVTVTVKGTRTATKTNEAGVYQIRASQGQVLVFTFIDYVAQEHTVGASDKMPVVRLVASTQQLGNVVVTAYGTRQNTRSMSYLAQNVSGEKVVESQKENWINGLQGRVAGASITPTSGAPGASSTIVLRGGVSMSQNNQPLMVIDGVPLDNNVLNQEYLVGSTSTSGVGFGNRNSDYMNRASDINPNDIESVTILKGPEAYALYGSDGASGAIVITTKKGKAGKVSMTYDNSFKFDKLYRFPKIQQTYGRGLNGISDLTATVNPFSSGAVYAYFGPKYAPGTKLYDNVGAFFQPGFTQKHNLTVEGGSDLATYRLSGNYTDQKGVVPNTSFRSMSFRLTGTAKFSSKFNLVTTLNYISSNNQKASKGAGGYLLNLLNFPSDIDVRDYQNPDGSRKLYRSTSASLAAEFDNPFWDVNKNKQEDQVDRMIGNLTLNLSPIKNLTITNILGVDASTVNSTYATHPQSRYGFSTNGFYGLSQQSTRALSNVIRGSYIAKFAKFSNTFVVGNAIDKYKNTIQAQRGQTFYERDFYSINNTDPLSRDAKTTIPQINKVRFFGSNVLNYDNMAYLTLAGSREANSTLNSTSGTKNPWFNYGSVGLAFVASELDFIKNVKQISLLKLRASQGTSAKGPASPYKIDNTFVPVITTGGGFAYDVTGNARDLKPERTKTTEFGGELKLFKNRLGIDITRYSINSKDQILTPRYSYGSGFVIKYLNGGVVENKGLEIVLTGSPIRKKNFTWDVTVNFDKNRGKVLEMPKGLPSYYESDSWVFGNLRTQSYVGASIGNLGGWTSLRNPNGDIVISPTSGLPVSYGDFASVGDRQPDFKMGIINDFTYGAFSLTVNLDVRKGGDVWNGNEYYLTLMGLSTRTLNREQPVVIRGVLQDGLQNTTTPTANTIVVTPYWRSDYYGTTSITESDYIESVDWVRLREASLNYRLPKKIVDRQKVFKSASLFVTGTDLFMITNYTGADPAVNANSGYGKGFGGGGIDFGAISTPRSVVFGMRMQF